MPGRLIPLVNGEVYHIFNRGSDKRSIFLQQRDYKRFLQTFFYYQFLGPKPSFSHYTKRKLTLFKPLNENRMVEILCYCLMPNHFHFLVRQLRSNGISVFMSQLSNSYTKCFNTKYKRIGALLQGAFKSVRIENDEQLIHVSRYIHLNPVVGGLVKSLNQHQWSSYFEFIGTSTICSTADILSFFSSKKVYKEFLEDQIDYGTSLELIKHQIVDDDI